MSRFSFPLLLIFLSIEIVVFSILSAKLGWLFSIGFTFSTSLLGLILIKKIGFTTMKVFSSIISGNYIKEKESFSSLSLLVPALLITIPGYLTDMLGILLFLPMFKSFISFCMINNSLSFQNDTIKESKDSGPIIDGDYKDLTNNNDTKKRVKEN